MVDRDKRKEKDRDKRKKMEIKENTAMFKLGFMYKLEFLPSYHFQTVVIYKVSLTNGQELDTLQERVNSK